jgi:protein suppressor of PHYA-105 1
VGVSRRVKIFDFQACLEGQDAVMHYPALQITTRSKLSSVCWNSYVKSQLITSDYGGLIQLWDASTAGEVAQYDEHARRVWSVDFSATDPMRFLSGSDDGSVRLWSVHEQSSVSRIAAPANVCSVQFSPADSHTIAFGCANYRVYLYDLRHTGEKGGRRDGREGSTVSCACRLSRCRGTAAVVVRGDGVLLQVVRSWLCA